MYQKVKFNIDNPSKVWFKNLQKARESKKWTQVRLATEIEVSQQSITFYETGTRVPSLEVAYKLAKVLGTSIEYLIGEDKEEVKGYFENSPKDEIISMVVKDKDKGD